MKKALSTAVALGLVVGMSTSAVASDVFEFQGEARVRGAHIDNATDANDNMDDTKQVWDQRVRLWLNANVADNVKVKTRFTVSDGNWNGASSDGGAGAVSTDYAWLELGILGGTYNIGRQPAKWGHKFMIWGPAKDRFKAAYKLSAGTVGGFLQKDREENNGDTDGDKDSYALFYKGSAGATKYGVIGIYTNDDAVDADGLTVDAFLTAKAGNIGIGAELMYKGGDVNESSTGDDKVGGFIHAQMPLGDGITGHTAFAYMANNGVADDDFTPTLLFGTSQVTAISNFGDTQTTGDDTTWAALVKVEAKLDDKLTVGGTGAYGVISDEADNSIIELDGYLNYALAKNTTLHVGIALGFPDDWSADDDMIISAGHKIEVKW